MGFILPVILMIEESMNKRSRTFVVTCLVVFFVNHALAQQELSGTRNFTGAGNPVSATNSAPTGRVRIQAIPMGGDWQANSTGASEHSVFTVQIDDQAGIRISTNSSGTFTNLSLATKHLVKIRRDDKPLASFWFTFEKGKDSKRLCYDPFYGTWSLSDEK